MVQPSRQNRSEAPEPFGKYLLLRQLARGGMAEIYLARQPGPQGFDRNVVIKRILPSLSEDQSFVAMFLDEARLASRLAHPNIAHIYDFGEVDGAYYLCMEYIPGITLSQLIRASSGGLPVEHAVKIACFLCDGLHFAHTLKDDDGRPLGIVHRDVSPQNVIISEAGGVKLLDFGIAHAVDQVHTTQQGVVKGKVSYMSPEQCRGRPLDGRSDIFSVATLIWESLAAERLFTRGTSFETMEAITRIDVPPLATYRADIPDGLDDVLGRAFAKKPEDRYPNAADMQINLERYLSRHQLLSSPPLIVTYLRQVVGENPPPPAIGEEEPPPGATTPAKRLPRVRPAKPEQSGLVEKAPLAEGLETIVEPPRDMTTPDRKLPALEPPVAPPPGPIVVAGDPLASGDGPTMHSYSLPALYTFSRIPSHAEQTVTTKADSRSKTFFVATIGFVVIAVLAAIVASAWRDDVVPERHPGPALDTDHSVAPTSVTPQLELRSSPLGASVLIDGSMVPVTTPVTLPFSTGPHRLVFDLPGYLRVERAVDVRSVASGSPPQVVAITLERRPSVDSDAGEPTGETPSPRPMPPDRPPSGSPPRPYGTGQLSVETEPWSLVSVGRRRLGETPVLAAPLPAGRHTLVFMVEGRRRVTKSVTIREGQHTKVRYRLGD